MVFLLFFALPACAADVPENLGAAIVVSENGDAVVEWFRNTGGNTPFPQAVHAIEVGKKISVTVKVSGMKPNFVNRCEASVSYIIAKPDGTNQALSNFAKIVDKRSTMMANPSLTMVFETTDPKGNYTIKADIVDMVTQQHTTAQYSIILK